MKRQLKFGDVVSWDRGRVRWFILGTEQAEGELGEEARGYRAMWLGAASPTGKRLGGLYWVGRGAEHETIDRLDDHEILEAHT